MVRYANAVDTRDLVALATCFTPDAVAGYWRDHELRGCDEITRFVGAAIEGFRQTQHLIGTHTFAFDGATATTTTYVQAAHVVPGDAHDTVMTVGGRYTDRFIETASGWRIAERRFEAMWTTEVASTAMRAGRLARG